MISRLFSLFILGLSDALEHRPFSCSVDPLTLTPASALLSQHVALPTYCFTTVVYFYSFPSPLPGALQSAQTSVLCSFLDISKPAENERCFSAKMCPFALSPPELPTDVCRQPMRPLNPRKPGGVIGFPGQLTVEFSVFSCGLFAHVHRWIPGLQPTYVDIVTLDVCLISEY